MLPAAKVSQTPERALRTTQHKEMLEMKVGPQSSLKTKGQKSGPQSLLKTNKLAHFHNELMKGKEIGVMPAFKNAGS